MRGLRLFIGVDQFAHRWILFKSAVLEAHGKCNPNHSSKIVVLEMGTQTGNVVVQKAIAEPLGVACCKGRVTPQVLYSLVTYFENHLALRWKVSGGWEAPGRHFFEAT